LLSGLVRSTTLARPNQRTPALMGTTALDAKGDVSLAMNDLVQAAVESQLGAAWEMPLSVLWQELREGRCVIAAHFNRDGRCYAILVLPSARPAHDGTERRNVEILRRVLCGEAQKVIAFDLKLSPSSVAVRATNGARAMGLACSASRIPTVVLMAAQAQELARPTTGRWSSLPWNGAEYRVVSAERPAVPAVGRLSPAESHIVDLLIDRLSNAEIAKIRRTSTRTVANQLARVQVKLRARGRVELLSRLIADDASPSSRP
jgi:DNA-binding NarL/FixJ family response regulator